jgi:Putative DNA-binding domain
LLCHLHTFRVDEILKICDESKPEKLRDIIFSKKTTNAFPSVFAILIIALHELIVKEGNRISDYNGTKKTIRNIADRIETGRRATSPDERRKNIDSVKGLIATNFVKANVSALIYQNHTAADVESMIRRSEIEVSNYELKQGLLLLSGKREVDEGLVNKVVCTICAIANNGKDGVGKIIIGVTDKAADAKRIQELDGVAPKKVGKRFVVGVAREAKVLNISTDKYFAKWKHAIRGSNLSTSLRDSVLSNLDYNSFFGLGVVVITIPSQSELSYVGDDIYWRNGDATERAVTPKRIAALAKRF